MTTIRFFFSAEQKDIIATINGGEALTVGDTAICFDGSHEVGHFGADIGLAKKATDSFLSDFAKGGMMLIMLQGGELNAVPAGYELIRIAEA